MCARSQGRKRQGERMHVTSKLAARSLVMCAALLVASSAPAQTSAEYDFNRDIRPVLSGKCFHCHGPDPARREADLRLDDRDEAIDLWRLRAGRTGRRRTDLSRYNGRPGLANASQGRSAVCRADRQAESLDQRRCSLRGALVVSTAEASGTACRAGPIMARW